MTLDLSDKSIKGGVNHPKGLLKLISIRACEKAHKIGMKLVANFNRWDEMQPYDIRELTESYYDLFANQSFKKFVSTCEDDSAREMYTKLHVLKLQMDVLKDAEYYRDILTAD